MNRPSLPCPACESPSTINIGKLEKNSGIVRLADPGSLFRCNTCGLFYRRPYAPNSNLVDDYRNVPDDKWSGTENRLDFYIAANIIGDLQEKSAVLDVGCYQGDFLAQLPETYRKYGIEPSTSARKTARRRGVTLVGSFLEDLELNQDMFDCITLFDVIEHLPSPLASLQKLALHLLPGGALLISTGNTDVVPWRLMRRHYWYYYTDHVSFFNPGWFDWAARRLDLSLERVKKFSRNGGSIWGRWRQFAQCLAFWTVQNTAKWPAVLVKLITAIYPFNRVGQWPEPPMANLWPDHILVVLQSKE